jgi:hypothetical protein
VNCGQVLNRLSANCSMFSYMAAPVANGLQVLSERNYFV